MPNHFEDRASGEVYHLNGAPVELVRQHAAPWGHTWIARYIDEDATFAIEPCYLSFLGWDLLGHIVNGSYVALPACELSVCVLGAGHEGAHRDSEGACWS